MVCELENLVHEEHNNMSEVLSRLSEIQDELIEKYKHPFNQ